MTEALLLLLRPHLGPCSTRLAAMLVGDPLADYDIEFPHGGGELFREVILK